MDCTLHLPYIDYDDNNFSVDNDYYSGDYASALEADYKKNKDIVFNTMSNWSNGSESLVNNGGLFNNVNNGINKKESVKYSVSKAVLFNENGDKETIDSIVNYFSTEDLFVLLVKFDFDNIDEEFEEDLKMWYDSHVKINSQSMDDDWKFNNEPIRNIKLTFPNYSGKTSYGELMNCKMIDKTDVDTFAILVEKLIFTKEF